LKRVDEGGGREGGGNSKIKLLSVGCEAELNVIKVMLSRGSTVVAMRLLFTTASILQPHTFCINQPKAIVDVAGCHVGIITNILLKRMAGRPRGKQENALEKGDVEGRDLWNFCDVGADRIALLSDDCATVVW
jgi:hypothetical protein